MKYSFTINQVAAVELGDVDAVDCMIIEWIRDICISQNPRIAAHRIKGHTWISYQYAIDDMPLLGLNSKPAFRQRLQGLIAKGYVTAHSQDQKVYVKPTRKMDRLFYTPDPVDPTVNPRLRHRKPQFTAPAAPKQGSAVNASLRTHNPNTNTQQNDHSGGAPAPAADIKITRFDEPKPRASRETVARMRQHLAERGIVKRPTPPEHDIVRPTQQDDAKVERHDEPNEARKPVKTAVKKLRMEHSDTAAPSSITQPADLQPA